MAEKFNNFEGKKAEIEKVLNSLGWEFRSDFRESYGGAYSINIATKSPAGENLMSPVFFNGSVEDFIRRIERIAAEFDTDEYVENAILMRKAFKTPRKIQDLLNDANAIKKMLLDLAFKLKLWYEEEFKLEIQKMEFVKLINSIDLSKITSNQMEAIKKILTN